MDIGELAFWVAIGLIAFYLVRKAVKWSLKESPEDRELRLRLEDPYIYDPETGAHLTLEEAERGNWIAHDNEQRHKSEQEIEKHFQGSEQVVEKISSDLKRERYRFRRLDEEETDILESTRILSRYNDWSYAHAFDLGPGKRLLFPEVHLSGPGSFTDYQIMFWVRTDNESGHYYLREKTTFEWIFDQIRKDDAFDLKGFEVFTITPSRNPDALQKLIAPFEGIPYLEIEIDREHLFVKTNGGTTEEVFRKLLSLFT